MPTAYSRAEERWAGFSSWGLLSEERMRRRREWRERKVPRGKGVIGTGHECWPVRIRAAQEEHGKSCFGAIDREVDTTSLESRYLPSSEAD